MVSRFLRNAIRSILRWALTSGTTSEAADFPQVQVTYQGKAGNALVWEPYGYHARVPASVLGLLYSVRALPQERVFLPGSPRARPRDLEPGEISYYHPDTGSRITFRASGDVEVEAVGNVVVNADGDATVDAGGDVSATAGLNATVDATVKVSLTAPTVEIADGATLRLMDERLIALFNAHRHNDPIPGAPVHSNDQISVGDANTIILKGS